MAVLSTLIVVIILQCSHTSNHQIVPLEYISFLCVSYISIKGKKKKENCFGCCVENGWLRSQDWRQGSQLAADVDSK